jgi:mannose/cellobiose epimerase-like protein (N-acyl-D-glucosamine 2-epimerase family)
MYVMHGACAHMYVCVCMCGMYVCDACMRAYAHVCVCMCACVACMYVHAGMHVFDG